MAVILGKPCNLEDLISLMCKMYEITWAAIHEHTWETFEGPTWVVTVARVLSVGLLGVCIVSVSLPPNVDTCHGGNCAPIKRQSETVREREGWEEF